MKLVLLGLALLQLATGQRDERLPPPGDGATSVYMEEADFARANYAKKHNIANMNALFYDMDLENMLAEELTKNKFCPEPMLIRRNNSKLYLGTSGVSALWEEPYQAGHTKTATIHVRCGDKWSYSFAFDEPIHPVIHGTPGSRCAPGRKPVEHQKEVCMPIKSRKFYRKMATRNRSQMRDRERYSWEDTYPYMYVPERNRYLGNFDVKSVRKPQMTTVQEPRERIQLDELWREVF